MKGKRILAAALSAAMLLGSAAQAAAQPEGDNYLEVRIQAAKEAMDPDDYDTLRRQMSGTAEQKAALANSGFQNGSDHIQVKPGETFWLAVKVDGSHLKEPYYGVGGGNFYYQYDSSAFQVQIGEGYMNHLASGQAKIDPAVDDLSYYDDLRYDYNDTMFDETIDYFGILFRPQSYNYYIPTKAEWDYAFPVTVADTACSGTYTIRFASEPIKVAWHFSFQLGRIPNGDGYLSGFDGTKEGQTLANDVTVEIVGGRAPSQAAKVGENAYVNGRPDGSFGAADGIRRDEFVKMLTVATGLYSAETTYPNTFPDVSPANWAAPYISTAVAKGLVTGLPDGTFGAARTITRGEAAAILARVLKLEKSDSRPFSDLEGDWAAGYVAALADGGYVNGYSDGTFRSSDVLHRVEAVKMINSALGVSFTSEETAQAKTIPSPFTDVASNYWAYADILYAAGLIEK